MADTGVFNLVANAQNWAKDGIEGDHVAGFLSGTFFDGAVAAADFDGQVDDELSLGVIDSGDDVVGVNDFDIGVSLNVFGGDGALTDLTMRKVWVSSP